MKTFIRSAAGLSAVILLSACGGTPVDTATSDPQAPTPVVTSTGTPSPGASDVAPVHNAADTVFAQAMITHQQQAVDASEALLAKDGIAPDVRTLATEIKREEGARIPTLQGWLAAWGEPERTTSTEPVPGNLADEDVTALENATGAEAARIYLTAMAAYYDGSLQMAQQEATAGKNPAAVSLAQNAASSAQARSARVNEILAVS